MTRALFLTIPLLAACVHTPPPCDVPWPRTCEERQAELGNRFGQADKPKEAEPVAKRPVDVSPPASTPDSNGHGDKSRDGNGGSSDGNSDDGNGGDSHDE